MKEKTELASAIPLADHNKDAIGFSNCSFSWESFEDTESSDMRTRRAFRLRIDGEVQFQRGKINLIVGPTGSGKTSLLMALLSEMHYIPMGPNSFYNLPRNHGVAYATQESWVLNETIRVCC